ncbi:rod shape-determining protein [Ferruginibacter albus]|uniref:rod shape-determining protein n=1 Tax=Ferruginibacter albus TaxID=2875540 RepID=UPI001CC3E9B8|nr:rod shape-determining protein [Ferruginibacter albus]UAY51671.1 rod shape-determining protein [Ferruginibacter albus]
MLFKRIPIYIKIYFNKVEITNLVTGKTVSKISEQGFSTKRVVIADFNVLELVIRDILKELNGKGGIFQHSLKALIQQMEPVEGGLVEIEKRALRDVAEQAGAAHIILIEHTRKLSNEEAILQFD